MDEKLGKTLQEAETLKLDLAQKQIPTRSSSHTRKQPSNHIPRPPNSFILFRSDFVQSNKLTKGTENDHRNISKIIGTVWNSLPREEKAVWQRRAEEEKRRHLELYPGYRYAPVVRREAIARRRVKKKLWEGIDSDDETKTGQSTSPSAFTSSPASSNSDMTNQSDTTTPNFHDSEIFESFPNSFNDASSPIMSRIETPRPEVSSVSKGSTSAIRSKPKDRAEVIAKLYLAGMSGPELEEEIRRREEEGRKQREEEAVSDGDQEAGDVDTNTLLPALGRAVDLPSPLANKQQPFTCSEDRYPLKGAEAHSSSSSGVLRKTKSASIVQSSNRSGGVGSSPRYSKLALSTGMSRSTPVLRPNTTFAARQQMVPTSMPMRRDHNQLHYHSGAPYTYPRDNTGDLSTSLLATSASSATVLAPNLCRGLPVSSGVGTGLSIGGLMKRSDLTDLGASRKDMAATIDSLRKSRGILAQNSRPTMVRLEKSRDDVLPLTPHSWARVAPISYDGDLAASAAVEDDFQAWFEESTNKETSPPKPILPEPPISMKFRNPFALTSVVSRLPSEGKGNNKDHKLGKSRPLTFINVPDTFQQRQRQGSSPFDNPIPPPPVPPRNYNEASGQHPHYTPPQLLDNVAASGSNPSANSSPPPPKIPPRPASHRLKPSQLSGSGSTMGAARSPGRGESLLDVMRPRRTLFSRHEDPHIRAIVHRLPQRQVHARWKTPRVELRRESPAQAVNGSAMLFGGHYFVDGVTTKASPKQAGIQDLLCQYNPNVIDPEIGSSLPTSNGMGINGSTAEASQNQATAFIHQECALPRVDMIGAQAGGFDIEAGFSDGAITGCLDSPFSKLQTDIPSKNSSMVPNQGFLGAYSNLGSVHDFGLDDHSAAFLGNFGTAFENVDMSGFQSNEGDEIMINCSDIFSFFP